MLLLYALVSLIAVKKNALSLPHCVLDVSVYSQDWALQATWLCACIRSRNFERGKIWSV